MVTHALTPALGRRGQPGLQGEPQASQGNPVRPRLSTKVDSLTSSLKYETPSPSDPAHVLKPQQGDVHAQLRTTLPNAADIAWAYSGNQGHCRRDVVLRCHRAQQSAWPGTQVLALVNEVE